ncbi:hypothetical protein T4E_5209 [Trichinella pseudospiralis]|uniref:Uncharacterized protein n=1 Tax=Trichinella pseudospiralis TaxID=6337 RepID=A0A0V0WHS1_TRIPS|nr:hypothetical protein T4E_5209 [Trichinella pseudospiralis]
MSYKDGNGDFVPRYRCYLTNRRVKAKRNLGGFYSTTTALFSLKITKAQ